MSRPLADKMALVRELERETFAARFAEILGRMRSHSVNEEISIEDIIKEVDAVRNARYSKGN